MIDKSVLDDYLKGKEAGRVLRCRIIDIIGLECHALQCFNMEFCDFSISNDGKVLLEMLDVNRSNGPDSCGWNNGNYVKHYSFPVEYLFKTDDEIKEPSANDKPA